MKQKMPWLKARLRVLGKTPTSLARHLNIDPPRVYEMISGRRGMQPKEIAPTAEFLDWSVDDLMKRLPAEARFLPHTAGGKGAAKKKEPVRVSMRRLGRSIVLTITINA